MHLNICFHFSFYLVSDLILVCWVGVCCVWDAKVKCTNILAHMKPLRILTKKLWTIPNGPFIPNDRTKICALHTICLQHYLWCRFRYSEKNMRGECLPVAFKLTSINKVLQKLIQCYIWSAKKQWHTIVYIFVTLMVFFYKQAKRFDFALCMWSHMKWQGLTDWQLYLSNFALSAL